MVAWESNSSKVVFMIVNLVIDIGHGISMAVCVLCCLLHNLWCLVIGELQHFVSSLPNYKKVSIFYSSTKLILILFASAINLVDQLRLRVGPGAQSHGHAT